MDLSGELAPVRGLVGHEAYALEEVDSGAGWAKEYVGAVLKFGAFEDDGVPAVLEGAADKGAASEFLAVNGQRLIFDSLVLNEFHRIPF